jgi:hypothetical protein
VGPDGGRYKQLMSDWKTAGRRRARSRTACGGRFKAAQDAFFTARSAHFSEQDEELRGNQKVKEEILAEAEQIDPVPGPRQGQVPAPPAPGALGGGGQGARATSCAPRGPHGSRRAEDPRRGERKWQRNDESPFTAKLREKVGELQVKLDKARAAGRPTAELEAALATQKQWLAQAGGSVDEPARGDGDGPPVRRRAASRPRPGPRRLLTPPGWR